MWWQAVGETVYLHLERPEELQSQELDAELIKLWDLIAIKANRMYLEDGGDYMQARATAALVTQNVHDIGYSPEFMGNLVPTFIGVASRVNVPVLTSLVIDEFMNNTWGPAN